MARHKTVSAGIGSTPPRADADAVDPEGLIALILEHEDTQPLVAVALAKWARSVLPVVAAAEAQADAAARFGDNNERRRAADVTEAAARAMRAAGGGA